MPSKIRSYLDQAPLAPCHKALVLRHITRLQHIIHNVDELSIGRYTNKQAAREQLARMTLVIRDYAALAQKKLDPAGPMEPIESAAVDIIDAALSTCGAPASFAEAAFVNSQLFGREQEVAAIMQEYSAESVDDVIELWNTLPEKNEKVVPDPCRGCDLGDTIDWEGLFVNRSKSEADVGLLLRRPAMNMDEFQEERIEFVLGRLPKEQSSRREQALTSITKWLASFSPT
ncbi:uncharacterized protein MYCFIDRAFT_177060 [Pseudocercospora fijiensis CIRAD86]|uniref:Uncharacterized protein n=1 Tax=Pseudocercospora fijiensis (strain CIRAD86) TaxID=383855 RepID=M3ARL3_PSEFD|nr:uncharacterized protein MYCFIDRAFT_177060 [Pseudocercospora fijiensis CIRAD86]EME80077.1 hypothetical protein MYCFIDRAFT_177060 [Pseudocercospora fijiensis CIRAD86]